MFRGIYDFKSVSIKFYQSIVGSDVYKSVRIVVHIIDGINGQSIVDRKMSDRVLIGQFIPAKWANLWLKGKSILIEYYKQKKKSEPNTNHT